MAAPVGSVRVKVSAGTAKFEAGMKKARAIAKKNGLGMEKSFMGIRNSSRLASISIKSLGSALIAMAGARAFLNFMKRAVQASIDFEKGLREVGTLLGRLTDNEMAAMSAELRALAVSSGQALDALVKAKYDVISAGFTKAADSTELLAVATKLAVGGVTDVATATDLLTTAVNAYGLEAKDAMDVSDKLFTIVRLGKTTISELGGSMGRLLAIAATMNVSLNEVGAALAVLTAGGQKTEEAVTAIRAAIVEFSKPSKVLADALKSVGIASGEALIKEQGLEGALKAVSAAAVKNNTSIIQLLANVRSMQAVLPLATTAAGEFKDALAEFNDTTEVTNNAVREMAKSTDLQLARMKEAFKAVAQSIADDFLPLIRDVAKALADALAPVSEQADIQKSHIQKLSETLLSYMKDLQELNRETNSGKNATAEQTQGIKDLTGAISDIRLEINGLKQAEIDFTAVMKQANDQIAQQVALGSNLDLAFRAGIIPAMNMATLSMGHFKNQADEAKLSALGFAGGLRDIALAANSIAQLKDIKKMTGLEALLLIANIAAGLSGAGGFFKAAKSVLGFEHGGAISGGVQKFASGGITSGPELFPMAQGMGLRGEAGPEAILPLARTSSGDLGVQTAGGGGTTVIQNFYLPPFTDARIVRDKLAPMLEADAKSGLNKLSTL